MSLALPRPAVRSAESARGWHAVTGLAALFALAWQLATPANTDVSWLLDCARRLLDGGRLYVDFIEVNPPASVLLYWPAAALARWLPLSGPGAVRLLVAAGFCASLAGSGAILSAAGLVRRGDGAPLIALATIALLALPMNTFGEREHIAVIASLPFLAACAARAGGARPSRARALAAGLAAGLAIVIKPMFGLAFAGPVLVALAGAGRRGDLWREGFAMTEAWAATALGVAYALGVAILVPDFATKILPIALDVYVPVRQPLAALLASPGFVLWLLLVATLPLARATGGAKRMATMLLLASAGFEAAALLQGKNFPYQALPAVALALLAATLPPALDEAMPVGGPAGRWGLLAILAIAGIGAAGFFTQTYDPRRWSPGLAEAMLAIQPHPRVLAISAELALGHPFVEDIGGTFVGREAATWISANADEIAGGPRRLGRLAPYVAAEQRRVAEDIVRQRPDFILIDDTGWMAWIASDPALAAAFGDYVRSGTYDVVALWTRRDLVR